MNVITAPKLLRGLLPVIAVAAGLLLSDRIVRGEASDMTRPQVYRVASQPGMQDAPLQLDVPTRGASEVPAGRSTIAARANAVPTDAAATIVTPKHSFPSLAPDSGRGDASEAEISGRSTSSPPLVTVTCSLAIVLGLFAALVWASRRFGSKRSAAELPNEAIENLGSHVIDARTRLLLIRCGQRVLIVSQTAAGIQPVSEVTDPQEVSRLISSCRTSGREAFDSTLREIEREPARGFVASGNEDRRGRLFATA